MSRIDQATVDQVVASLQSIAASSWTSIRWELQDGAEFLLVRIELVQRSPDRTAPQRTQAFNLLSKRIPPKPNGEYSWMIVFTHGGEVVDSLMAGVA